MERKAPKVEPDFSSIPCDEGGKRHIKGCPHNVTKDVEELKDDDLIHCPNGCGKKIYYKDWPHQIAFCSALPKSEVTSTWIANAATQDKTKWTDKDWMLYHMDYLEGVNKTLSLHRAVFAAVLTILAVISIIK